MLEYQFEQSARRLKHVYETAMKESQEPGMDYNKYVFISFIKYLRWVEIREKDFLPYVGDFYRVRG